MLSDSMHTNEEVSERGVDLSILPSKLQPQPSCLCQNSCGKGLKHYHIWNSIQNCMAGVADRMFFVCTVLTSDRKI